MFEHGLTSYLLQTLTRMLSSRSVYRGLLNDRSINHVADIDECSRGQEVCRRGQCQNVEGSYICECGEGYRLSRFGDECMGEYFTYCGD